MTLQGRRRPSPGRPLLLVGAVLFTLALWVPAPMASAQLTTLLKLAGKAAKGAAKAGKAGKVGKAGVAAKGAAHAAKGAHAATGLKALAVGSLAFSEARAGRLFASLGDDVAAGARYVTREGDQLRVLRNGPDGVTELAGSLADDAARGGGNLYIDTPALVRGSDTLELPAEGVYALTADGTPHAVRALRADDGTVVRVVDVAGDLSIELAQFGLDQALNGSGAQGNQGNASDGSSGADASPALGPLRVLAVAEDAACEHALLPRLAGLDGVAPPPASGVASLAEVTEYFGGDRGEDVLLFAGPAAGVESALVAARDGGRTLTALNMAAPCDAEAMLRVVREVTAGRRQGQRAPLLGSRPFDIDYVDHGEDSGLVARGRPVAPEGAAPDMDIVAAAWVAHDDTSAVTQVLEGAAGDGDRDRAPTWFITLVMIVVTLAPLYFAYRFLKWVRRTFRRLTQ